MGGTELVSQLSRCECLQVWVMGHHCQKCLGGVRKEGRQSKEAGGEGSHGAVWGQHEGETQVG